MKASSMAYQGKMIFNPFVMPKWAIQVFYIEDKLHASWLLVHEAEAQTQLVICKSARVTIQEASKVCAITTEELE